MFGPCDYFLSTWNIWSIQINYIFERCSLSSCFEFFEILRVISTRLCLNIKKLSDPRSCLVSIYVQGISAHRKIMPKLKEMLFYIQIKILGTHKYFLFHFENLEYFELECKHYDLVRKTKRRIKKIRFKELFLYLVTNSFFRCELKEGIGKADRMTTEVVKGPTTTPTSNVRWVKFSFRQKNCILSVKRKHFLWSPLETFFCTRNICQMTQIKWWMVLGKLWKSNYIVLRAVMFVWRMVSVYDNDDLITIL